MKKFLYTILIFLLLSTSAWAGSLMMIGGGTPVAGATPFFPCKSATQLNDDTTVIFCEDFENPTSTSCQSGSDDNNCWHTFVQQEPCNTVINYQGTGIFGNYAAYCNELAASSTCSSNYTISRTSAYVFGKMKFHVRNLANGAGMTFFRLSTTSGTANKCAADIYRTDPGGEYKFAVYNDTTQKVCTDCPEPTIDTVFYIWLEYVSGTSCTLYVSTTATKPTTTGIVAADSTPTATVTEFAPIRCNADVIDEVTYDNIIIKATAIGNIAE